MGTDCGWGWLRQEKTLTKNIYKSNDRFHVTSFSSPKSVLHQADVDKIRSVFQSGSVLESMEKHEKNIFYNIRHEDDLQNHDCLNETFICSSNPYEVILFKNINI